MTFKEQVEALKSKIQGKLKPESSQEEIEEISGIVKELDSLVESHDAMATENAKFKDQIVKMVMTQGNSEKPAEESSESKPKTIEEIIAEELAKGEK